MYLCIFPWMWTDISSCPPPVLLLYSNTSFFFLTSSSIKGVFFFLFVSCWIWNSELPHNSLFLICFPFKINKSKKEKSEICTVNALLLLMQIRPLRYRTFLSVQAYKPGISESMTVHLLQMFAADHLWRAKPVDAEPSTRVCRAAAAIHYWDCWRVTPDWLSNHLSSASTTLIRSLAKCFYEKTKHLNEGTIKSCLFMLHILNDPYDNE